MIHSCTFIPKVANAMDYISNNKKKTEALVKEFVRVNDKNTKKGSIRLLQQSGALDSSMDEDSLLQSKISPSI